MPLPFILGAAAAAAAVGGVGAGVHGAIKMKDASDTQKSVQSRHEKNVARFEKTNEITVKAMDDLGKLELEILGGFEAFSDLIEQIQGRPEFRPYSRDGITIPQYNKEKLHKVSLGAGVLLGGLGGAAVGTAGGFAAAGATTAAVMALGTASTGTAIASLSGVAATNATLAALGGGAIAAGGGGIALGTTILGATTLGVGLLIGGIIFDLTSSGLSQKAEQTREQMIKAEKEIDKICEYLGNLYQVERTFQNTLVIVYEIYKKHFQYLDTVVNFQKKTNWADFTQEEKLLTENTVLLVGILYRMCQVNLVKVSEGDTLNTINYEETEQTISYVEDIFEEKDLMPMVEKSFPHVARPRCDVKNMKPDPGKFMLQVLWVTKIETGQFRVRVKVYYAPVHVGDRCTVSNCNKKVSVARIGFGNTHSQEKEAGKITEILLKGEIDTSELENQVLVQF